MLETIERLQQRIAGLEERLNQNSNNSSMPPSSDPLGKAARRKGKASGRKRGGQPGHQGQTRTLKSVEQVDRLIDLRPVECCGCGALLLGEDLDAQRHQVTELPRIEPCVIEYRRHTLPCLVCGTETTAEWPTDMPTGSFGPGVQAIVPCACSNAMSWITWPRPVPLPSAGNHLLLFCLRFLPPERLPNALAVGRAERVS